MLTPADVEQKTFSTALRGYDLDEVDDFLDDVVATLRALTEQLEAASASGTSSPSVATVLPVPAPEPEPEPEPVTEPEPEPTSAPAPVDEPTTPRLDESAIGRALLAAQTAADKLLEDAQSEASRIVDGAKSEADSWSEEREMRRREAEAEIAALASRVSAVRSELSVLAGEVADKLDEMDAAIATADDTDTSVGPADHLVEDQLDVTVEGDDSPDDSPDDMPAHGANRDHLDEMLSGVANDLRLGNGEESDDHDEANQDDGDGQNGEDGEDGQDGNEVVDFPHRRHGDEDE